MMMMIFTSDLRGVQFSFNPCHIGAEYRMFSNASAQILSHWSNLIQLVWLCHIKPQLASDTILRFQCPEQYEASAFDICLFCKLCKVLSR